MFLDDSWNGLNQNIARDIRDKINSLLHEELIEWCIEYEIYHLNMTDEEIERFNRERISDISC